jgi:AcrR family transcriptional regulator
MRNQECILAAARAAFAEGGASVALEEIARRAGVGIATLYRRYPTGQDLVSAAFEPKLRTYAAAAEDAVAEDDAWQGFTGFVKAICAMQAADAGFADVVALTCPVNPQLDERHRAATANLDKVVERAKAERKLRADFVIEDLVLVLLLIANAGVGTATRHFAPRAGPRFATLMLDAFRMEGASPLPSPVSRAPLTLPLRQRIGAARAESPGPRPPPAGL